jgi:hypothetical protein
LDIRADDNAQRGALCSSVGVINQCPTGGRTDDLLNGTSASSAATQQAIGGADICQFANAIAAEALTSAFTTTPAAIAVTPDC